MNTTFNYKNVKSSASLNARIEELFGKFDKYFSKNAVCHAVISEYNCEGKNAKVEITIISGKQTFRAEARAENFYAAVDEVFEKIKKQIRRYKDKTLARKRADQKLIPGMESVDEYSEELIIARSKRFKLYPMSIEDAVLQMETSDHNFFIYLDKETSSVNVVYKRETGEYGLIETY